MRIFGNCCPYPMKVQILVNPLNLIPSLLVSPSLKVPCHLPADLQKYYYTYVFPLEKVNMYFTNDVKCKVDENAAEDIELPSSKWLRHRLRKLGGVCSSLTGNDTFRLWYYKKCNNQFSQVRYDSEMHRPKWSRSQSYRQSLDIFCPSDFLRCPANQIPKNNLI